MKKRNLLLGIVLSVIIFFTFVLPSHAQQNDETAIMAMEQRLVKAFNNKDVDGIMSLYVPDESLIVFDVVPPRQYVGANAYRKNWEGLFAAFPGPISYKLTDLEIMTEGTFGMSHSIQSVSFTDKDGKKFDIVVRVTDVYRKLNGNWLIVHEHVSVPVDLATDKPVFSS